MSERILTDNGYGLLHLLMWADEIERENPLLAEQLKDLYILLNKYDDYLSEDVGRDNVQDVWRKYKNKWINADEEELKKYMMKECERHVDTMIKGWRMKRD